MLRDKLQERLLSVIAPLSATGIKKNHLLMGKIFSFDFYPKAFYFEFHGPPLLMFKTDLLDLRGLDPGKVTSKAR